MKKYLILCCIMATLIISGCKVGGSFQQPVVNTPVGYTDANNTDSTPLVKWFELFKDTALQTIIKTTLDSNRNLLIASSRVLEAQAQFDIIHLNQMPSFNYQLQAGGGTAGTDALKVAGGLNSAAFKASGVMNWEIDLWGKLRGATASARAQMLATIENTNALKVSLVADAASLYFLLRDLDNRLLIAQRTVASRKENTKIITERYSKGYISELDRFQAVQQEAQAEALVPNIKRQIRQTENALNLLMARSYGIIPRGSTNFNQILPPAIPVGLPSQLLERRPDIRSSQKLLESQFEKIGVAIASRYPSFSLTGLLGFASPQLSSLVSNGFVANGFGGLVGPIFQFGQNKRRVDVERIRTQQSQLVYEQTILASFTDVNNALIATKTFEEEYAKRKIQVDAGTKALELSQARYDYGYTSYLEVLIQENNLFDAELQESVLMQQKLNSIVSLYRALGGGWN
ncbi:MAG: efflux transporter outer membrane subunit [Bacteroidota bacterium]